MIKNKTTLILLTITLTLICREVISLFFTKPSYVIFPGWHSIIISPFTVVLYGGILVLAQILIIGYIRRLLKKSKTTN